MLIILGCLAIFVVIFILYKISKLGAHVLAIGSALLLLAMTVSILFSSHISKLNCYYYSGHYEKKCVSILNNISSSMQEGESRINYDNQLNELSTYLYYSKYSIDDMKYFKSSKEKEYNILKQTYDKLNIQSITADKVVSVINSSKLELENSNGQKQNTQ